VPEAALVDIRGSIWGEAQQKKNKNKNKRQKTKKLLKKCHCQERAE
jgi:hypothetical protein